MPEEKNLHARCNFFSCPEKCLVNRGNRSGVSSQAQHDQSLRQAVVNKNQPQSDIIGLGLGGYSRLQGINR
jgi:hypothetical protein